MVLPTAVITPSSALPFIVRPAGDTCNLRCSYCYLGAAVDSPLQVMSEDCLKTLTREASEMASKVEFLWHGGEPLLAGPSFFETALDFQRSTSRTQFANFIQSNGTLINDEWAGIFAQGKFHVRLSLDGPRFVHDRYRKHRSARGSQNEVIRAIEILQNVGINPAVSCVITEDSVPYVSDIYNLLRELNILKASFLPAFIHMNGSVLPPTLSPEGYVRAYTQLFDIWAEDTSGMSIRELEGIVSGMLGRPAGDCTFTGTCATAARVESDGSVYPCELHVGEHAELYGRVGVEPLFHILARRYTGRVGRLCTTLVPEECRKCKWYSLCHGGCYAAYVDRSDGTKFYYYCEARKQLFSHISQRMAPVTITRPN
ncbi:MAG: radical SAM protein [Acidobacteria bacterium]|nr:radical SAM protein [Acidobacteriota bacterium]